MNYLVAPRNYDRDYGRPTPGFGDMDEYGLPRGMSPEDKREVLDRFPLPDGGRGVDSRGPSITPGSNPMGVSTEMRGLDEFKKGLDEVNSFMRIYEMLDPRGKQDALKDLLFRPTDNFDIRKHVYRPEDKVEVQPLTPETGKRDFLYQYLEQNKEVMGPKNQMFGRYANPEDGTLTFGAPQGPAKVLVDGPPPRRRPTLFDLNVDFENTSLEELKGLQKMLEDMYKDSDELILNQAEPTGMRMAADPSFVIPREASLQEIREINRRLIPDYDLKREKLRRGFLSPLLRGV